MESKTVTSGVCALVYVVGAVIVRVCAASVCFGAGAVEHPKSQGLGATKKFPAEEALIQLTVQLLPDIQASNVNLNAPATSQC